MFHRFLCSIFLLLITIQLIQANNLASSHKLTRARKHNLLQRSSDSHVVNPRQDGVTSPRRDLPLANIGDANFPPPTNSSSSASGASAASSVIDPAPSFTPPASSSGSSSALPSSGSPTDSSSASASSSSAPASSSAPPDSSSAPPGSSDAPPSSSDAPPSSSVPSPSDSITPPPPGPTESPTPSPSDSGIGLPPISIPSISIPPISIPNPIPSDSSSVIISFPSSLSPTPSDSAPPPDSSVPPPPPLSSSDVPSITPTPSSPPPESSGGIGISISLSVPPIGSPPPSPSDSSAPPGPTESPPPPDSSSAAPPPDSSSPVSISLSVPPIGPTSAPPPDSSSAAPPPDSSSPVSVSLSVPPVGPTSAPPPPDSSSAVPPPDSSSVAPPPDSSSGVAPPQSSNTPPDSSSVVPPPISSDGATIGTTASLSVGPGPTGSVDVSSIFPSGTPTLGATDSLSVVETGTPAPIPSEFSFITVSSLVLGDAPSVTPNPTMTDPDAAVTSAVIIQSNAPVPQPSLPADLPQMILAPTPTDLDGYTFITIAFRLTLNWKFVATNVQSVGQLFLYTPQLIYTALKIDANQVKPYGLAPYAAKDYNGDPQTLYTTWQGYIPNNLVDPLQNMINARQSAFYTDMTDTAGQLAQNVIVGFPLRYAADPSSGPPGTGGPNSSPNNNATTLSAASTQRRNAIIGVVAAIGGIALIVLAWWLIKSYRRRRDAAHRPLGDADPLGYTGAGYGATEEGMRERPPSVGPDGIRRNSFYFAEDSLRGYTDPARPDEVEAGVGSSAGGRRPVGGQAISGPVLRQNTLGY